jgi:endogenous inhibitor of DNA gyrase (YacG/DUF329 family)
MCGQPFDTEQSTSLPFCSARCRSIDLGRWLDERYGVPVEREKGDQDRGDQDEELPGQEA